MSKLTRKEARDLLFGLLFETEFHSGDDPAAIFDLASEAREVPGDKYIRETFFGVVAKSEILDAVIGKYSKGWKAERLSKVSRTVIRIAVYEILFVEDIPANVSISQAVELTVKYAEDKAKQFVNGVLSSLFKDTQAKGLDAVIAEAVAAVEQKKAERAESEAVVETASEEQSENEENA